jgi:hypothetical protein
VHFRWSLKNRGRQYDFRAGALAVVVCVGATALLLTGVARAHVQIVDASTACTPATSQNVKGSVNINIPGVPCLPINNVDLTQSPFNVKQYCVDVPGAPQNFAVAIGGWDNVGCRSWEAIYCYGNAKAGGSLGTSALPDSVIATVGLYPPGGGHNVETCDSCRVYLNTNRSTPGQITLSVSGGGLMINAAGPNQGHFSKYRVIAYPNQAAADADPNREGFGSVFFGEVVLEGGAVDGGIVNTPPTRSTRGGFTDSDWILQSQVGGTNKYVTRPNGTITKVVTGVNASTAVVVAFGDPGSFQRQAVPGYSPIGLVLLALGLLGSGFWVIRSRQRVETA